MRIGIEGFEGQTFLISISLSFLENALKLHCHFVDKYWQSNLEARGQVDCNLLLGDYMQLIGCPLLLDYVSVFTFKHIMNCDNSVTSYFDSLRWKMQQDLKIN